MTSRRPAPAEFVADDPRFPVSKQTAEIQDFDTAKNLVRNTLVDRITELKPLGKMAIMLSGGIDSQLVLAAAAEVGIPLEAFTVAYPESDAQELVRARSAADIFGVPHRQLQISHELLLSHAQFCVQALGSSDFWEVGAAMPLVAANDAIVKVLGPIPILSGSGADALFHGGTKWSGQSTDDLNHATRKIVERNFTAARPIPDFYERIIGSESRYFQIFQTWGFWDAARVIDPRLNFRSFENGTTFDKWLLRSIGEDLGLPKELTRTRKDPIQTSSGLPYAITRAVAQQMSQQVDNRHYSDPATDSLDVLFCRLYFSTIGGR